MARAGGAALRSPAAPTRAAPSPPPQVRAPLSAGPAERRHPGLTRSGAGRVRVRCGQRPETRRLRPAGRGAAGLRGWCSPKTLAGARAAGGGASPAAGGTEMRGRGNRGLGGAHNALSGNARLRGTEPWGGGGARQRRGRGRQGDARGDTRRLGGTEAGGRATQDGRPGGADAGAGVHGDSGGVTVARGQEAQEETWRCGGGTAARAGVGTVARRTRKQRAGRWGTRRAHARGQACTGPDQAGPEAA